MVGVGEMFHVKHSAVVFAPSSSRAKRRTLTKAENEAPDMGVPGDAFLVRK